MKSRYWEAREDIGSRRFANKLGICHNVSTPVGLKGYTKVFYVKEMRRKVKFHPMCSIKSQDGLESNREIEVMILDTPRRKKEKKIEEKKHR